jgi:aspartate racemase
MKTIGLIGGMSWESSLEYYRLLNKGVKARLGGLHNAKSLMFTVDFAEIAALQKAGAWNEAANLLSSAAQTLERSGADCVLICTNTMHKVADQVQAAINIPLIHIADATAEQVVGAGITRVGLLGTAFTMEQDFYRGRLLEKYGLEVLVPEAQDRQTVHRIIFDELCLGTVDAGSKLEYMRIMADLTARGAQGIILGCTEIMLLVGQADSPVPTFDTTALHVEKAVAFALEEVGALEGEMA